MTAQPTEDRSDPLVILRDLPERDHEEFLRQYHQAVDAARDPAASSSTTTVSAGASSVEDPLPPRNAGARTSNARGGRRGRWQA